MGLHECRFHNDTSYDVAIHDYDGNRTLRPGETELNKLMKGGNYYINLTMKFPNTTDTERFYASDYQGETHYMSHIFRYAIERERKREREEKERERERQPKGI